MLTEDYKILKLCDFGLAKEIDVKNTERKVDTCGTLRYMVSILIYVAL